jgi:hypothetical protein
MRLEMMMVRFFHCKGFWALTVALATTSSVAAAEEQRSIFLLPSGEVAGRTLSQTARIEDDKIVVCTSFENTSGRSVYLTTSFNSQVTTTFGSRAGERDVPDRSVFPGGPVSSPMPFEDRSFFVLERDTSITLCRGYDIHDFQFGTVRVQSVFKSWLQRGTLSAPIVSDLIAGGVVEPPLYSDELLHSNTCDVNRRRRTVSCKK